jgi:hypothetical protein
MVYGLGFLCSLALPLVFGFASCSLDLLGGFDAHAFGFGFCV